MPKFFVRWRINPKETFKTAEERGKFVAQVIAETRAELQVGIMKDWGTFIDGSGGYCVYEASSEEAVFESLHRWTPQTIFDVRQVLTVDQLLATRSGVALPSGKQT